MSDQNGHFVLRSIVPGDYKLFVSENIEPYAYNDPEVLRKYEERGTPIIQISGRDLEKPGQNFKVLAVIWQNTIRETDSSSGFSKTRPELRSSGRDLAEHD